MALCGTSISFINSSIPVSFNAEIFTTFVSNICSNFFSFIISPFCSKISAIFSATITFASSSKSWVVKYKLLSSDVLSTIFIITSGFSSNINFLDTSSSTLYGLNEYIPGKSVISWFVPFILPVFFSIVTPGQFPILAFIPVNTLNNVVFPLFWFPTNAIFIITPPPQFFVNLLF